MVTINEQDHMMSFIYHVSEINSEPKCFKLPLVLIINMCICLYLKNSRLIREGVVIPIRWIFSRFIPVFQVYSSFQFNINTILTDIQSFTNS